MSSDEAGADAYGGPILYYTDAVIEHFQHPRNIEPLPPGEIDGSALDDWSSRAAAKDPR